MAKYLSSVMKILPATQARQIADMLQELRAKGEIRDTEDYQNALSELASLVNARDPKPTFEQIRAMIWGLCKSDAHNAMMRATKNDLEAIFLQTDEIGRRLDDQHSYMMRSLIADLEKVLQDQEDRVRELKIKSAADNEFNGASLNSFARTALQQMTRAQCKEDLFFFDNRTGQAKDQKELPDVYISEHGNKLVLPSQNDPGFLPINAKLLFEEDSFDTADATVSNSLSNVIDGKKDTFWSREVYLDEATGNVSTTIEFDFGTGRDVNYCIIEGATGFPFYISEMYAVGMDGHVTDLLLRRSKTSVDLVDQEYVPVENKEIKIEGHERIDFFQVFAKSVRIKFSYSSFEEADFYSSSETSVSEAMDVEYPQDIDLSDLAPAAEEALVSTELAELCNVQGGESEHINASVYRFCLDNVWFGNSLYGDEGIFVSEATCLTAPGVISMKAQEKNVGFYLEDSDGAVQTFVEENDLSEDVLSSEQYKNAGSVEYEAIRHWTDSEGNPRREHFPVPMLGQEKVVRERIVLTKRVEDPLVNDVGALRFAPRVEGGSGLHVFRNGKEIACGTGPDNWQFATRKSNGVFEWKNDMTSGDWSDFRRWNMTPQKMWLKFNKVSPGDIFTVSYTIRTSVRSDLDFTQDPPYSDPLTASEAMVYMDSNKMLYMGEDGRIIFVPDPETGLTKKSNLYVQVTLRRNSPQFALSPEVIEYMLLTAPYKPGFADD